MLKNLNCYISTELFHNLPFRAVIPRQNILVQVGMVKVILICDLKKKKNYLREIDNGVCSLKCIRRVVQEH